MAKTKKTRGNREQIQRQLENSTTFLVTGIVNTPHNKKGYRYVYMCPRGERTLFSFYQVDAQIFTYEEAVQAITDTCRIKIDEGLSYYDSYPEEEVVSVTVTPIIEPDISYIKKSQLRRKLRQEFQMNKNTPFSILADMCEDKGMIKEAELLRLKV